jgi:hypothetical protein
MGGKPCLSQGQGTRYPHELWTTRLLARHVREHAPAAGHNCLAKLAQGTLCNILNEQEIKPHKVRYYLERRDLQFKQKMAEVLCVYREVKLIKERAATAKQQSSDAVAIVSYDEKPAIQAIAVTAPDLSPEPGLHATFARDHEYKRYGTVSLLAGIDLRRADRRARELQRAESQHDNLACLSRTRSGQGSDPRSPAAKTGCCPACVNPRPSGSSVPDARPHESPRPTGTDA